MTPLLKAKDQFTLSVPPVDIDTNEREKDTAKAMNIVTAGIRLDQMRPKQTCDSAFGILVKVD